MRLASGVSLRDHRRLMLPPIALEVSQSAAFYFQNLVDLETFTNIQ
jgi:hypothetical protein